jgi:hypothetical protein
VSEQPALFKPPPVFHSYRVSTKDRSEWQWPPSRSRNGQGHRAHTTPNCQRQTRCQTNPSDSSDTQTRTWLPRLWRSARSRMPDTRPRSMQQLCWRSCQLGTPGTRLPDSSCQHRGRTRLPSGPSQTPTRVSESSGAPGSQARQADTEVAAVAFEYVPDTHAVQADAEDRPATVAHVPAGQGWQNDEFAAPSVPLQYPAGPSVRAGGGGKRTTSTYPANSSRKRYPPCTTRLHKGCTRTHSQHRPPRCYRQGRPDRPQPLSQPPLCCTCLCTIGTSVSSVSVKHAHAHRQGSSCTRSAMSRRQRQSTCRRCRIHRRWR